MPCALRVKCTTGGLAGLMVLMGPASLGCLDGPSSLERSADVDSLASLLCFGRFSKAGGSGQLGGHGEYVGSCMVDRL